MDVQKGLNITESLVSSKLISVLCCLGKIVTFGHVSAELCSAVGVFVYTLEKK